MNQLVRDFYLTGNGRYKPLPAVSQIGKFRVGEPRRHYVWSAVLACSISSHLGLDGNEIAASMSTSRYAHRRRHYQSSRYTTDSFKFYSGSGSFLYNNGILIDAITGTTLLMVVKDAAIPGKKILFINDMFDFSKCDRKYTSVRKSWRKLMYVLINNGIAMYKVSNEYLAKFRVRFEVNPSNAQMNSIFAETMIDYYGRNFSNARNITTAIMASSNYSVDHLSPEYRSRLEESGALTDLEGAAPRRRRNRRP
jgi:hypothetical protein